VERGTAADHRRLARRPVLNGPIQLIGPASPSATAERPFRKSGTDGSNPVPSSEESATNRSRRWRWNATSKRRDRWFESSSLQRRVRPTPAARLAALRLAPMRKSNPTSGWFLIGAQQLRLERPHQLNWGPGSDRGFAGVDRTANSLTPPCNERLLVNFRSLSR